MLIAETNNKEMVLELQNNLDSIREKIRAALVSCPDPEREVTIVAASKKQPWERIQALAQLGHIHFGENYVQEGLEKIRALGDKNLKWHFIGGLQSNKAKYIPEAFHLVHSLDSYKTAQALSKRAQKLGLIQEVLIQVNLGRERQKAGIWKQDLHEFASYIYQLESLRLSGLMLMPPLSRDPEESRPYFAELRTLKDNLEQDLNVKLPHLSMGMSQDYVQAVQEGATLIRLGSVLLGSRPECGVSG